MTQPGDTPGEPPGPRRIRIIIVDDSVAVRGLFSRWLAEVAEVEIVGIHRNGLEALRHIGAAKPDIVILDIEMPEMDGLTALPLLLEKSPESRVLVVSSMSVTGADVTLRCLMRGATDYLAKPSSVAEGQSPDEFRATLISKILAVGRGGNRLAAPVGASVAVAHDGRPRKTLAPKGDDAPDMRSRRIVSPKLLVIGASTGGPPAVVDLVKGIGSSLAGIPVVVAQHMPALFTSLFSAHLNRLFGLEAVEIKGGETLKPGCIHVCRGGQDVLIESHDGVLTARAAASTAESRSYPSVDVLFASAADAAGAGVLAIVLTGTGEDGAQGAAAVTAAGGVVMIQDQRSSAVWGMPGAVYRIGAYSVVDNIAGLARAARGLIARR